jgi:hypothetical protein
VLEAAVRQKLLQGSAQLRLRDRRSGGRARLPAEVRLEPLQHIGLWRGLQGSMEGRMVPVVATGAKLGWRRVPNSHWKRHEAWELTARMAVYSATS